MSESPLPEHDAIFKLLLIGDSAVGKSSLLLRYADGVYLPGSYVATVGVDFKIKNIELDSWRLKLQLWDTAGQERFRTLSQGFYRGAHGVVVVYDVTDRASFSNAVHWLEEITKYSSDRMPRLLVGNKRDLTSKRVVAYEEGSELAAECGIHFFETSARDATNVEAAFLHLVSTISQSHNFQNRQPRGKRLESSAAKSIEIG
eukprot:CAMPEP_0178422752 /NCGR_PEP_ID=MMETSP0689_2-20121128/27336_1 /TAXON_ID=160604 /ORGANISM="Amphidinium massartii, Strain CS-259" /LENGTH=201 /DNA_ID=CAMNT_0020044327 /DNA_START=56 /DNA_END=658 /DNA_ORIENTATION=-